MFKIKLGITLIELILVIAIFSVIAAAGIPISANFISDANYYTTRDNLISIVRKAQGYSTNRKLGYVWGVCKDGSLLKLYGGNVGASCSSNIIEESFTIPSGVDVNGFVDTTFNIRGEPVPANNLSNITITSSSKTTNVSVNRAGGINVQ